MTLLPPTLIDAIKNQRAILFLGAGASIGAHHPDGKKIPSGDVLRDAISDKFLGGTLKNKPLPAVAAFAASEIGLVQFQKFVHDLFFPYQPAEHHQKIATFRWRAIATTNFDLLVERSYKVCEAPLQNLVETVKDNDRFDTRLHEVADPVGFYKLHGCITKYTDESIPLILGQEQYASHLRNRRRFYDRLRDLAYECPVIFCGYSLADPHIQELLFDLTDVSISRPPYFVVSPDLSDIEIRYWAKFSITGIKSTFQDFVSLLDAAIPLASRKIPISLGGGDLSIRMHYRVANANESASLVSFLGQDAKHVYAGMRCEPQDAREFYKGLDKGWGCIEQNLDVRRTICDSVLVDAILLNEEERQYGELFLLKGPAGNGKTVALKRVAWDAATTYEQLVLYADNEAGLRPEPIQEIFQLTGKRIFLFVDRVALLREPIHKLLDFCRARTIPLTIIGAERDNEWNIYCDEIEKFLRQDFLVRYLSEAEINELLILLERHDALGLLKDKTQSERIDAFARAERQLLVALHEATLGAAFEQILLDEYKRIEPARARRLYLEICALHQFGAPVRAGLISRASGIGFEEFGEKFIRPLENVVVCFEDRHTGDAFYRTRHQHIAELVFNLNLTTPEEKYDVLVGLIGAINTAYSSDRETFSRLVKGRSVAQIFTRVELGRLLYERAEATSPGDSFVLHQQAVFEMQHGGGSLRLAEAAAKRAADANPQNRSIQHTQAEIARRLALEAGDPLKKIALRRFAREKLSVESGRLSEYDLGTRARLAIDELKEIIEGMPDEPEKSPPAIFVDAVKSAELAVQRALQAYPGNAEILAAESNLRDLLEQTDRAQKALERAFRLNPRQDWVAVRLAKRYLRANDTQSAIATLEKCLKENPSSKDANLELARLLENTGAASATVLDLYRKSFVPGDTNFEGQFWYARELFLQGRQEDAMRVFTGVHERAPARFHGGATALVTNTGGAPRTFSGRLERKEEGYAFVKLDDFENAIFCSRGDSSSDLWDQLRSGSRVTCKLAFNRRGPRAIDVRVDVAL